MIQGSGLDRKYLPVLSSRIITDSAIRRFATVDENRIGTDPLSTYRKYAQDATRRESIHVLNPSWVFWDLQKVKSMSVRTTLTRKRVRKRVVISSVNMVSHSARDYPTGHYYPVLIKEYIPPGDMNILI
jgi:hypothetical protein